MTRNIRQISCACLLIGVISLLVLRSAGCRKDDGTTNPPVDTTVAKSKYGKGTMTFDAAASGGGHFSATGPYRPSSLFAGDTLSQGVGGFADDTTFQGKRIEGMFVGDTHALRHDTLNERIMIIALHTDSGSIRLGDYPFSRLNTSSDLNAAYVYFFFSDSVSFHDIYYPKSGTCTLTSFNPSTGHAIGTFSGILYGPSPGGFHPDTSKQIEISNGEFDIICVSKYFAY